MEDLQIGNWLVIADGIEWTGKHCNGYFICKHRLLQCSYEHKGSYDWLIHMAHKKWITEEDIYTLNTAMMYALEYFKQVPQKAGLSFVKTVIAQQQIIRDKPVKPVRRALVSRFSAWYHHN